MCGIILRSGHFHQSCGCPKTGVVVPEVSIFACICTTLSLLGDDFLIPLSMLWGRPRYIYIWTHVNILDICPLQKQEKGVQNTAGSATLL